jgi:hypothetical protein
MAPDDGGRPDQAASDDSERPGGGGAPTTHTIPPALARLFASDYFDATMALT